MRAFSVMGWMCFYRRFLGNQRDERYMEKIIDILK